MADTESQLCPFIHLEEEDLDSPLSGGFLQDMESIKELSQSISGDSSGAFSVTDFQLLGSGPGSDGSIITGRNCVLWRMGSVLLTYCHNL